MRCFFPQKYLCCEWVAIFAAAGRAVAHVGDAEGWVRELGVAFPAHHGASPTYSHAFHQYAAR